MPRIDRLNTVKEVRRTMAYSRTTLRQTQTERSKLQTQHQAQLLRLRRREDKCYEDLSALYKQHRQVCPHRSNGHVKTKGLGGRFIVTCRFCNKQLYNTRLGWM